VQRRKLVSPVEEKQSETYGIIILSPSKIHARNPVRTTSGNHHLKLNHLYNSEFRKWCPL
jgi:hypothetical protein